MTTKATSSTTNITHPQSSTSGPSTVHTLTKINKSAWVQDAVSTTCYGCGADFTITRRKHHCRLCGFCFCGTCSSKRLSHRKSKKTTSDDTEVGTLSKKSTGLFAGLKAGINALTGDVKQIRVCDTCYETEKLLSSSVGGATIMDSTSLHLDSSDEEIPSSAKSADNTAPNSPRLQQQTSAPSTMSKPRKGALPQAEDEDDETDESTAAARRNASPVRLERRDRKLRLTREDVQPQSSTASSSSAATTAAPSSSVVHSHTHCLFSRYFRVGAREKIKLLIPDPVLLYFGNKKNVNDLSGLGDGGCFGSASSGSQQQSAHTMNVGHAAIWNHMRSVVHGHPCSHAQTNHSSSDPHQHFDCQVPYLSKCAESFPFRYGSLAITNYQLIWIPMLLPPNVNIKSAQPPNNYFASSECETCQTTPSKLSNSTIHTTSTCCSQCGCVPLMNEWEHIANNSIGFRRHHASITTASSTPAVNNLSHQLPSACNTCIPIQPIVLPLLALSRFRLRTFEKQDFGLLDLRSKTFNVIRFLFPGLISRNRFGSFRNIAICLDWFSKVKMQENNALGATSPTNQLQTQQPSNHDVLEEHEVVGLKKIAFAWKYEKELDVEVGGKIPPEQQLLQKRASLLQGGRMKVKRTTAHLTSPPIIGASNGNAASSSSDKGNKEGFVGSDELLSSDDSDEEDDSTTTADGYRSRREAAPHAGHTIDEDDCVDIVWAPSSLTGVSGGTEEEQALQSLEQQQMASSLATQSSFIPASLAIPTVSSAIQLRLNHGWTLYDHVAEYSRLGLLDPVSHYRLSTINRHYKFSPTYPKVLCVPKSISDKELEGMSSFRSKARIPCVVWNRRNVSTASASSSASASQATSVQNISRVVPDAETVMLRSAQPMVGITRTRNHQDELFLQHVVANSPCNKRFMIADARPLANAVGQQALGKGYELIENYQSHVIRDIGIHFLDIANIHVMRESEEALFKLCQHFQENLFINGTGELAQVSEACGNVRACTQLNAHQIITGSSSSPSSSTSSGCPHACGCNCCSSHVGNHGLPDATGSWWTTFLATGHFEHLTSILRGANFITKTIQSGTSCLVHCSDGWDRTSQLTSLSQLALDPFYRTMHGFFILICKEWLSFGHKYGHRVGHGGIGGRENSPVFTQFLDCVYQFLHQFPSKFEFHSQLLLALRHSLHSGKYGTFFGNSEGERFATVPTIIASTNGQRESISGQGSGTLWRLLEKTPSVFAQLWQYRSVFINYVNYEYSPQTGQPFMDANTEYARNNPLIIDIQQVVFWKEFYLPGLSIAENLSINRPTNAPIHATPASNQEATILREQLNRQREEMKKQSELLQKALNEVAALKIAAAVQTPLNSPVSNLTTPAISRNHSAPELVAAPDSPPPPPPPASDSPPHAPLLIHAASVPVRTNPVTATEPEPTAIPSPPVHTTATIGEDRKDADSSGDDESHDQISSFPRSAPSKHALSTSPLECEDAFDADELLRTTVTRPRAIRNTGSQINPNLPPTFNAVPRQSRQRSRSLISTAEALRTKSPPPPLPLNRPTSPVYLSSSPSRALSPSRTIVPKAPALGNFRTVGPRLPVKKRVASGHLTPSTPTKSNEPVTPTSSTATPPVTTSTDRQASTGSPAPAPPPYPRVSQLIPPVLTTHFVTPTTPVSNTASPTSNATTSSSSSGSFIPFTEAIRAAQSSSSSLPDLTSTTAAAASTTTTTNPPVTPMDDESESDEEDADAILITRGSTGAPIPTHVEWCSDASVVACKLCYSPFTFIRRKHHCRACGEIYCSSCAPKLRLDGKGLPGLPAELTNSPTRSSQGNFHDQPLPKPKRTTRICLACKKENKVHINVKQERVIVQQD